jgi:hypothetical protein
MSTRAVGRGSRRGRRVTLAVIGVLAAGSLGACGSKDFPNDPRPPAPIEVSAKVDSKRVVVSPNRFGAGLVTFTVANLSASPIRFTVDGTKKKASTSEIQPGAPGYLKVELPQGDYRATAGPGARAHAAAITVGPERKSSQNKLLLP